MKGRSKSRFEVPEALTLEILLKLPIKSLARFNCVCKSWCSSFRTLYFSSKHYHNNLKSSNLNVLFQHRYGNTLYFSQLSTGKDENSLVTHNICLPFFENCVYHPQVYGPCNGLLCLYDHGDGKAALWNPSTGEFKILPRSSSRRPPFPGYTSFKCVGFGYDSKTDDYKVIHFITLVYIDNEFMYPHEFRSRVELYSLRSDSWKEISSVPKACPFSNYLCSICIDGICYWEAMTEYHRDNLILSFDMVSETFSTLHFPDFGGSLEQYNVQLLEFNGSLGVIVHPRLETEKSFDLWVMNGAWTKQFSIESISGVKKLLGFWKNGELFYRGSSDELLLFEPSTQELKKLGINAYPDATCLVAYVESLVPINGRSEHDEHITHQSVRDA
ncbi:hypothetical protein like AT3G06240 [Hibiscus trionum]|uniref:F-box domain-containing protein n=1 Tax=Hibiscus trionum TaxID=183268 RepID=A0A9W7IDT2_HIBTR|nr:hypothetical protein like AT3G06240 [Hibiscus trionum]